VIACSQAPVHSIPRLAPHARTSTSTRRDVPYDGRSRFQSRFATVLTLDRCFFCTHIRCRVTNGQATAYFARVVRYQPQHGGANEYLRRLQSQGFLD
jgi:hypothetical protein